VATIAEHRQIVPDVGDECKQHPNKSVGGAMFDGLQVLAGL